METRNQEFVIERTTRYNSLKSNTLPWHDLWQQLAQYFAPRMAAITVDRFPADVIEEDLYNDTGKEAAEDFAAGCVGYIIPPGESWARFESKNQDPSQEERDYWAAVTRILLEDMVTSSFHLAAHDDFFVSGVFGTSTMRVEEGNKNPFRFSLLHPGKYELENNPDDEPDIYFQEVKWTAKQCEDKFGRAELHDNMIKDLEGVGTSSKQGGIRKWKLIYLVQPREDSQKGLTSPKMRPFAEFWFDEENKHQLSEGGFYENPYITNRMYLTTDSFWGHSLGMRTLPKNRMLNQMDEDIMLAQELRNNPPWLAPDDSSSDPVNTPGGTTYYKADKDPRHAPRQVQLNNAVNDTEAMMIRKQDELKDSWFSDMFRMFAEAPKNVTATAVIAMIEQKLVLFTPFFTRYTKEKLGPIMDRCLRIDARAGRLPEPPADVIQSGGEYRVVYSSRIALAVKLFENRQLLQLFDLAGVIGQIDPTALQVLNTPEAFRKIAENMGVDPKLLNSEEDIRAALAQEQSMQQALQTAEIAEKGTKAMSQLPDGGAELANAI